MDIFWESEIPTGISPDWGMNGEYYIFSDGRPGFNPTDWSSCGIYLSKIKIHISLPVDPLRRQCVHCERWWLRQLQQRCVLGFRREYTLLQVKINIFRSPYVFNLDVYAYCVYSDGDVIVNADEVYLGNSCGRELSVRLNPQRCVLCLQWWWHRYQRRRRCTMEFLRALRTTTLTTSATMHTLWSMRATSTAVAMLIGIPAGGDKFVKI